MFDSFIVMSWWSFSSFFFVVKAREADGPPIIVGSRTDEPKQVMLLLAMFRAFQRGFGWMDEKNPLWKKECKVRVFGQYLVVKLSSYWVGTVPYMQRNRRKLLDVLTRCEPWHPQKYPNRLLLYLFAATIFVAKLPMHRSQKRSSTRSSSSSCQHLHTPSKL